MTTYFSMCNIEVTDDSEAPECDECYVITMWSSRQSVATATAAAAVMRQWFRPVSILGETFVAWQLQPQLQLQPIAATITLCKHRVRGLTKPQVTSILRLSSRMLSCLYTSLRPIGQSFLSYCIIHRGHDLALIWLRILTWCREMFWFGCQQHTCLHCMLSIILLLYVSNLWRIFSKCTFWQHSSYFQFSFHTLPFILQKTIRIPQNTPSRQKRWSTRHTILWWRVDRMTSELASSMTNHRWASRQWVK